MTLFVIATAVFISLTFVGDISFYNRNIEGLFEDKNKDLANIVSAIDPTPPYKMPKALRITFDNYNEDIVNQYGLTNDELSDFIKSIDSDPAKFNATAIEDYFDQNEFFAAKFLDHTGWMIGRDWQNFEEFEANLKAKIPNINEAIISEYGLGIEKQDDAILLLEWISIPEVQGYPCP